MKANDCSGPLDRRARFGPSHTHSGSRGIFLHARAVHAPLSPARAWQRYGTIAAPSYSWNVTGTCDEPRSLWRSSTLEGCAGNHLETRSNQFRDCTLARDNVDVRHDGRFSRCTRQTRVACLAHRTVMHSVKTDTHLARTDRRPLNGPEHVRHPRTTVTAAGGIIVRISRRAFFRPDRRTGRPAHHGRRFNTWRVHAMPGFTHHEIAPCGHVHGITPASHTCPAALRNDLCAWLAGFRTQLPCSLASAARTGTCATATRAAALGRC